MVLNLYFLWHQQKLQELKVCTHTHYTAPNRIKHEYTMNLNLTLFRFAVFFVLQSVI